MFTRLLAGLAAILLAATPAAAAPHDAVMNKEGYWGIDVDDGACAASMTLQGGSVFLLRAVDGKVTFALFGRSGLARGKTGRIETEAYGFDFKPSYVEGAPSLYYDGDLDARALAALRLARQVRILTDGQMVAAMTFEGTGFESALDGVVACSKGQSGWWGKGLAADTADEASLPVHKGGVWRMEVGPEPGFCTAVAPLADGFAFTLTAADGQMGFGVFAPKAMKRGRKGRVETDKYSFDFKPGYDGEDYMFAKERLDSQAQFALRRATSVWISIDGKPLIDMGFEDFTHAEIMDDVAACSRGEKGWWNEPAKPVS